MFLVLWGHCIQFSSAGCYDYYGDTIFKFIYSFHMPLFALISGYLFYDSLRKRTLWQSVKTRLSGLLYPIVLWCTARFGMGAVFDILNGEAVLFSNWWSSVTGMFLWFLWSILAASICIAVAVKLLPERLRIVGIVILCFAMYLFPNHEMNLYLYPYFAIGYYAKKTENIYGSHNWKQIVCVAIPIFVAMLMFFHSEHYIYNSGIALWASEYGWLQQLGIDIYRYVIGLVGSVVIIALVICGVKHVPDRFIKVVASSGKISMQLYVFQCFCLSFIWSMVWTKIVGRIGWNPLIINVVVYWMITFIMAVALMVVLSEIIRVLNRLPRLSKVLFGR